MESKSSVSSSPEGVPGEHIDNIDGIPTTAYDEPNGSHAKRACVQSETKGAECISCYAWNKCLNVLSTYLY